MKFDSRELQKSRAGFQQESENASALRISSVELSQSMLILVKENIKYTNYMEENPHLLKEIFAQMKFSP